jgi:hypothetical protein
VAKSSSTDNKPVKRKLNISDEERQRRSQRAKQRIAEGKMGGQFGKLGGRPRKPRASDLIAEEAERHKNDLVAVLKDAIDPSQPISIRLRGLDQWLGIERDVRRMEMDEDEHYAKMSREELAEELANKIAGNPMLAQIFAERMNGNGNGEVIDAEVVEDDDDTS